MTRPRYECNLDPDLLQKAISELNEPEDNDARLAEIDKLRTRFLEEQTDFELLRSDDSFILRFLRAKKFNHDKAYETLLNYHRKRSEIRDVYDKVDDPKSLSEILDRGGLLPIRQKARDGSTVIISRPGVNWYDGISMFHQVAAAILLLENLLEDESVQDAIPLRLKAIHMVNEYKIFALIYAIAKPFMKEKIKKRMTMHGGNLTGLHEVIDPKGLPDFLAGTGPDLDIVGWKEKLLNTSGHGEETNL